MLSGLCVLGNLPLPNLDSFSSLIREGMSPTATAKSAHKHHSRQMVLPTAASNGPNTILAPVAQGVQRGLGGTSIGRVG